MSNKSRMIVVGHTTRIFLAVSCTLCIGFCLLFPAYPMHGAWAPLLPGFEWLTPLGFLYGLLWSYLWGWYIAIIWVPLHNIFNRRYQSEE